MPTAANKGKWRPTKNRYVFFCTVHFILYFYITTKPTKAHSSQRRPTQAHSTQRRPMQAHEDEKGIGMFFFVMYILFFIFQLLRSPRRPTTANAGQRRSTQAHSSQRRPMQAHDSQRRPTKPTKDNTGLVASAQANVHRYFFFLYTKVVFVY